MARYARLSASSETRPIRRTPMRSQARPTKGAVTTVPVTRKSVATDT
jgi:hypothetical protein